MNAGSKRPRSARSSASPSPSWVLPTKTTTAIPATTPARFPDDAVRLDRDVDCDHVRRRRRRREPDRGRRANWTEICNSSGKPPKARCWPGSPASPCDAAFNAACGCFTALRTAYARNLARSSEQYEEPTWLAKKLSDARRLPGRVCIPSANIEALVGPPSTGTHARHHCPGI